MSRKPQDPPRERKPQTATRANLDAGRINQKLRTRDALVAVAADFVRRGQNFSVADVADKAHVSRPTAYRYFSTPELLRAQATLFAAGRIQTHELDQLTQGSGSPEEKLDALIMRSDEMTASHEAEFRSLLRLSLDPGPRTAATLSSRPQFRQTWLASALAELKDELGESRFKRLVAALSLMTGIESMVVLRDVLRLKPQDATEVKRWAARLLLHAAIHEAAHDRATRAKPRAGRVKR